MAKHYRHGDVSFHQVSPEEAKKMIAELGDKAQIEKNVDKFVVALGEVTGHKHVMTLERPSLNIWGLPTEEDKLFQLKAPGTMTHEEHHAIVMEPGFYVQKIEREFDPFSEEARRALD